MHNPSLLKRFLRTAALVALLCVPSRPAIHGNGGLPLYGARENGSSVLLSNADGTNPYTGIVRYQGRASCTGVFLATAAGDRHERDAPAYVLTNGHCPAFPGANDVLLDQPGIGRIIVNFFADTPSRQVSIPVTRVPYVTMKEVDIAVLELEVSYGDLVSRGLIPWIPAARPPFPDEPVIIVGAPVLRDPSRSFLRLAACRSVRQVPLVIEFQWHWFNSAFNECRDVLPGSSGSPVISRLTGRLIGLVNTTTTGALPFTECALDHPCEPVASGAKARPEVNYAMPLAGIAECFDSRRRFDLRQFGCPLDPGNQPRAVPPFIGSINPRLDTQPIGPIRRNWNVTVSGASPYYRYKVAALPRDDCRIPTGYTAAISVVERSVISDPLPRAEGIHLLCIEGLMNPWRQPQWPPMSHPTIVEAFIDTTAPRIPAQIRIDESEQAWLVTFGALAPEVASHTFKFGRPFETHCEDPAGYRLALVPFISLPKANRPYIFCAVPYDGAQNPGPVFERLLS